MRYLDANSGTELSEGLVFQNVLGTLRVLELKDRVFFARFKIEVLRPRTTMNSLEPDGRWKEVLDPHALSPGQVLDAFRPVRVLHPAFVGQRVAFFS